MHSALVGNSWILTFHLSRWCEVLGFRNRSLILKFSLRLFTQWTKKQTKSSVLSKDIVCSDTKIKSPLPALSTVPSCKQGLQTLFEYLHSVLKKYILQPNIVFDIHWDSDSNFKKNRFKKKKSQSLVINIKLSTYPSVKCDLVFVFTQFWTLNLHSTCPSLKRDSFLFSHNSEHWTDIYLGHLR